VLVSPIALRNAPCAACDSSRSSREYKSSGVGCRSDATGSARFSC
jgi:hypothetical protein